MKRHETVTKSCADLLLQVKECILREPSQFDMDRFYGKSTNSSCGTVSCIAGWGLWLDNPKYDFDLTICHLSAAMRLFQLGVRPAINLFYQYDWPQPFRDQYEEDESREGRAKVAAKRIDHFIKTGE